VMLRMDMEDLIAQPIIVQEPEICHLVTLLVHVHVFLGGLEIVMEIVIYVIITIIMEEYLVVPIIVE